jgi:NADPH:quinone reductase-like Zn-dependent oxidoreductase
MKAVVLTGYGGPEVLQYVDVPDPVPLRGEALVRVRACGVNHLDLDIRSGVSRLPIKMPHVLGRDLAGEVVALNGADWPPVGTRVAAPLQLSCMSPSCRFCSTGRDNLCPERRHPGVVGPGGYRELATFPADSLVPAPVDLAYDDVVAGMLSYSTAWHGLITLMNVVPGETVLVTGAAGAVGIAAVQMARLAGAWVLAAVGSDRKRGMPTSLGVPAEQVINYATHDLAGEVRRLTDGRGADAVLEIAGGSIFSASLEALAPGGRLCVIGAHAGEAVSLDLVDLFRREVKIYGSSAYTYAEVRNSLQLMGRGLLKPPPHETLPLSEAAEAHRRIHARENLGKVVLVP